MLNVDNNSIYIYMLSVYHNSYFIIHRLTILFYKKKKNVHVIIKLFKKTIIFKLTKIIDIHN